MKRYSPCKRRLLYVELANSMSLTSPIAVTGASGFIASWVVKYLIEQGLTVHATVRNPEDSAKTAHLDALANAGPGKLRLFKADLLEPEGFAAAFEDCSVVFHLASPFRIQGIKDAQRELIQPALSGTRHVLEAVNHCSSIQRVVLTSSIVAIHCDAADHPTIALNEEQWNETASESYQPYAYSKTLAEREAWKIAKSQSRWSLATINPGFVIGPSLSTRVDSTSVDLMLQLVDGRTKNGIPDIRLAAVDVRDVAKAHLLAADLATPQGRYLVADAVASFPELAAILRELYGEKYPLGKATLPKALMYLVGPFMGFSWRYVKRNFGVSYLIDNSKSRNQLGLTYLPTRQTLKDTVDQFERLGLVRAH